MHLCRPSLDSHPVCLIFHRFAGAPPPPCTAGPVELHAPQPGLHTPSLVLLSILLVLRAPFLRKLCQLFAHLPLTPAPFSNLHSLPGWRHAHTHQSAPPSCSPPPLCPLLASTAYGKVFLVRKAGGHDSGKLYAMKVLRKAALVQRAKTREHTRTERSVLELVRQAPFLVTLHYAFQTDAKLHLILGKGRHLPSLGARKPLGPPMGMLPNLHSASQTM